MSQAVEAVAPRKEVTGLHRMTETGLRDLCRKNKLYQTPRLNDVLYLHYQGYQYIECLDEYTELKCLWLECNAISEIEGLDKLSKLKCLFLQNNLIKRIDNLASCPELDTLNLSSNHIRKIENIGSEILPVLNTLNISTNYLKDSESLAHLVDCKTLAVLDLSNNRIDDILVVKIFEKMPCLKVLVLQGNPVVSRLPQYRKTLILACKELTYLDSRPVFPRDRACAEAWKRDGYEGERKENMRWNRADRKKMRDSVNYTIKLRNRHRPAEEQAALISSTDSEGEKDADKGAEKTRLKAELEYGCVDDIWSEVSGDNKDNDSSGSSGTADEPTDGSQAEDIAEQLSSRRAKPLEGRPKVLHESEFADEKNTKKAEVSPRVIAEPEEAVNKGQELRRGKRVLIEEVKLDELDVECKKVKLQTEKANNEEETEEKPTIEDVQVKADEEIKSESTKAETIQLPELIAEPDSDSELDQSTAAALKESCEKLGAIALNDLSEPTPEQIKQEAIDRMYGSYGSEIFAEQPEFDETMLENKNLHFNSELQVNSGESLRPQVNLIDNIAKTQDQLEYEEECNEANDIVEYNLDELSTHLDEDLDELRQPLEELRGPPVDNTKESTSSSDEEKEADKKKCVELTTVVRSLRIIEEFSVRRERICEEIKDQEKKAKEEQANKTLIEEIEQEESDKQVEAELDAMDAAFAKMLDDCSDDVAKRVYGAGLDKPSYEWHKEECMRQLTITEKRTIVNEDEYKMRPINEQTSAEQAEFICEQMSQKLAEDEASMRELLQELEDEVDVLSDVTDTLQDEFALEFPEPPVEEVCVSLLDGLIDELQYREIISGQNIKCFDFGLIESDEEYSYSADPKVDTIVPPDLEDPAGGKSLRECIDAFGDFLSSVNDRKTEWKLDKKRTSSGDKVQAAKELLKSRMMTAYQAETPEELIAKLAKQEEKTKRRVAAMTERCYDKRQNLEDSLEVIDNKLVIVKKDTGLVEDLPPPPALISDSESDTESESSDADGDDDYDTAEEVNEEPRLQTARAANARGNWPKAELTECEALQSKDKATLEEIRDEDSVPDQSIDEFYSLEARAAFNSLDSEFLDKLDLQKVIGSDGEITVEGMRNYDRLKDSIKPESVENVENPDTALVEQDEMLKDLIERKRLQEERERQLQELASSQDLAPHKLKSKEITDKLEGEIVEEKCLTEIREGMQKLLGNKDEPKELLAQAEIKEETEIDSEQQEEELELEDLTHAENLGAIQLTLGSCKLYELKSQLPENHGEEEAKEAVKEAEERSDKETETLKTEVLESANDKAEDADIKQTNATNNLSIDEDIISDNSTDYESGEDIPVVEPPKLPEGALNELFSNEIEDKGLQLERENEEALRKELFSLPLRAWASQELTNESEENVEIGNEKPDAELVSADVDAESSEVLANKANENEEETDSEANGAIGELARNAKRQWAKISQKLNEFIAADDIELLEKGQFNEDTSYDEDDDELEASLKQMNALYKGCDKEVKESIKGDKDEATEKDGKQDLKIEEIERNLEEELQNNKIAEELDSERQTSGENEKNLEELSTDVQQEMESLEKTIDATKDQICEDIKECEQTKNDNDNPINKPTIRLDYFEPDNVDFIDADFDEATELKTDEIECNLEILNEDGDAVVQEVSVNAQVTYEFK